MNVTFFNPKFGTFLEQAGYTGAWEPELGSVWTRRRDDGTNERYRFVRFSLSYPVAPLNDRRVYVGLVFENMATNQPCYVTDYGFQPEHWQPEAFYAVKP